MKKLIVVLVLLTLCVSAFAQTRTPFPLPDKVSTAWQKPCKYEVVKPNILKVSGSGIDMDGIYFRDIPYKGEKYLVIVIKSMEGRFPWDKGKMFGVTTGNPSSQRGFLVPEGRVVLDRMIDGPFAVGDEVKMALPADIDAKKTGKITLAMTIFTGAKFEIELWFEN